MSRPRVAVIGGGPGGLMAAERLAAAGAAVTVHERMPSMGRKLLLAGRSGLNLTNDEPLERLLDRYGPARSWVEPAIRAFPPSALRAWCASLGEPTFVGSTGRVFPQSWRATPLLRAWLRRLQAGGVELRVGERWVGWDPDGRLLLATAAGDTTVVTADAVVLALGGASWPRTGSDGSWADLLAARGVHVVPLRPANCGFDVAWSPAFVDRFAGVPLKNVRLATPGAEAVRAEAMITRTGLEGGGIYLLAAALRTTIKAGGPAELTIDLHPDLDVAMLTARLARRRPADSTATALKRVGGLAAVAGPLLREDHRSTGPLPSTPAELAQRIKDVRLLLVAARPLDRAISTAGGIALDELDEIGQLRTVPGVFPIGEMLDWEAPTGGYLLQATFSTAVAVADRIATRLALSPGSASV